MKEKKEVYRLRLIIEKSREHKCVEAVICKK